MLTRYICIYVVLHNYITHVSRRVSSFVFNERERRKYILNCTKKKKKRERSVVWKNKRLSTNKDDDCRSIENCKR